MSTYISVNEKREKNWMKNALAYRWGRLLRGKRNKKLWLFSAWEGEKYSDNTKYFYEYILENHPEITCIWQTKNRDIFNELLREDKPVQLIGTPEAAESQKKAGVVFYTNGLDDFGEHPQIYGAVIVALWHGVGFKKIYRELKPAQNILRELVSNLKWNFFSWVKRDITVVTSEDSRKHEKQWFALKDSELILIAGQPRNDIFSRNIKREDVIKNTELLQKLESKQIVLYMPTFRKELSVMMQHLEELWESESFAAMLEQNNAVFLAKLHYLNMGNLKSNENMILLNDRDVLDAQALMCCADILVTDYSSCAIDFALQNKPVLFYFPDWEEYGADECMREGTKEACSINCAESAKEFEMKLKDTLINPQNGLKQCRELNRIFDGTGVRPGRYSENVYNNIIDHIGK